MLFWCSQRLNSYHSRLSTEHTVNSFHFDYLCPFQGFELHRITGPIFFCKHTLVLIFFILNVQLLLAAQAFTSIIVDR